MDLHSCRWVAEKALRLLAPEVLNTPVALASQILVLDSTILGVTVRPASCRTMGDHFGQYFQEDRQILLRQDMWDALQTGTGEYRTARATVGHELGHHLLDGDPRVTDEEADAWAVAGCLLMPCEMVQSLDQVDDVVCSRVFDVSPQFAYKHLMRMKQARLL